MAGGGNGFPAPSNLVAHSICSDAFNVGALTLALGMRKLVRKMQCETVPERPEHGSYVRQRNIVNTMLVQEHEHTTCDCRSAACVTTTPCKHALWAPLGEKM